MRSSKGLSARARCGTAIGLKMDSPFAMRWCSYEQLVKRQQVCGDRIDGVVGQLHGRHPRSGFECFRIGDPLAQVPASHRRGASAGRGPGHEMRQIGAESAVCVRSRYGVAVDTCGGFEDTPTLRHGVDLRGGSLLTGDPALEI